MIRRPTRRQVLAGAAGVIGAGAATAAYALAVEPGWRLVVREWRVALPGWGGRPPLAALMVADLHAGAPHMTLARVERIVAAANALAPDVMLVMGDLPAHHPYVTARVPMERVAGALAGLRAPLGVHAILGNHDWWDDPRDERRAAAAADHPAAAGGGGGCRCWPMAWPGCRMGRGVWLAGLDSQWAFGAGHGVDDLDGTLARVTDDAPVVLLAHEPDIFPRVPARVSVTFSGHTHGGQVRVAGYSPWVPSRFGNRFAYGVVREEGRVLVVSGGLGCSIMPVRLGVPPELTIVRLSETV